MTYRDDFDALSARHAVLQSEVARKQRELAEVTTLLAEAQQVDQAEAHFSTAPVLRRRQRRHLFAGALIALLASVAVLGSMSASSAEPAEDTRAASIADNVSSAAARTWKAAELADRRKAAYEALQQIGLTAKEDVVARRRAKKAGVPFDQYLYREELASLSRKHQR